MSLSPTLTPATPSQKRFQRLGETLGNCCDNALHRELFFRHFTAILGLNVTDMDWDLSLKMAETRVRLGTPKEF